MAKRSTIEDELSTLRALAGEPNRPDLDEKLSASLRSRQNIIAARAAEIALQLKRSSLGAELIGAFDRFLNDPKFTDKGCQAKTAIAKALYEFGDANAAAVFLAGVKYIQKEAAYGPPVDVAVELRGICGLGLVRIGHREQMHHLVDLLADPEPQARCFAARALAYSDRPEAALLVRFKLHTGDREIDVVTECMNALVRLEPTRAAEFLGEFLEDSDPEIRSSAALALGETRSAEALELFQRRFPFERDPDVRRAILLSAGLLRLPLAIDWLISRVEDAKAEDAATAIEALALYRRDPAVAERVQNAAGGRKEKEVAQAFAAHFTQRP
ncbi:MAG TPA: HEAT repeat domain-containing protein [Tepidisphaeraceae bacterium]|jgi:HEAT repeat protein